MNTNHNFPELIRQVHDNNHAELEAILHCGLPWMMLDLHPPMIPQDQTQSWIDQWFHNRQPQTPGVETEFTKLSSSSFELDSTHSSGWKSRIIFGPSEWCKDWHLGTYEDEYNLSIKHRNDFDFEWHISEDNPIRQWLSSMFADEDLLTVTAWFMQPGGHLTPHSDHTTQKYGLHNFYWAVKWDEGNEFGFYRYGNAPIKEGSVCLINNYGHPHWVINNSNTDRLVLSIGADLTKIKSDIIRSWDLMHSLGRGNNP